MSAAENGPSGGAAAAAAGAGAGGAGTPAPPMTGAVTKGIVKCVLSADSIVIRGQPRNGPPPEKTICIAGIQAPKLARRPATIAPGVLGAATSEDEPFAWECREFLRKKLVGKEVTFVMTYKTMTGDREYGEVYFGSSTSGENLADTLISQGLCEVRQGARESDALTQRLRELEGSAKAGKKGRWGAEGSMADHVRKINWSPEISRTFVDSYHGKPIPAVIEQVRDGATVRAFLVPEEGGEFQYVTLIMSGVRAPVIKLGEMGKVVEAEQYAEEAKFFTEVRLLQRDVEVVLESTSNQSVVGSVLHPAGSIAELLLKEGYAKCVDWSIAISQAGAEKLRAAERVAKEKRLRIWREYSPAAVKDKKTFQAKVMEVVNGDALMLLKDDGSMEKVWLASVRPPKREESEGPREGPGRGFRPLYDVPFMFEAREFLRKRLIHKRVGVSVDYVQPGNDSYPARSCCTVTINGQNVAEALVAKGLGTVLRYRQDDENRSAAYDALLAAESKAEKSSKGVHSLKGASRPDKLPIVRVQDLQGDANKARQFLPYLQRAGKCEGIVEFVASGSRLRVFIPKETCLVTILLTGISCPRSERVLASGVQRGEQWGNEALAFTKERVLQREVEIEVEAVDKAGSFIGWVKVVGEGGRVEAHLAVELVKAGLASVHHTAEFSNYASLLYSAEEEAKKKGEKLWLGWSEQEKVAKAEAAAADVSDRRLNYRPVCITDLGEGNKLAVQFTDDGPKLEKMMGELRREMKDNPPVTGSYNPRRGDMCAAKFSADGQWYRAKVEDVPRGGGQIAVLYVDFGNRERTAATELAPLPATFQTLAPGAKEFLLAFLKYPEDADYVADGRAWLGQELGAAMRAGGGAQLMLNPEYRIGTQEYATLVLQHPAPKPTPGGSKDPDTSEDKENGEAEAEEKKPVKPAVGPRRDIGRAMLEAGLAVFEPRKDRRFASLAADYAKAQEDAKRSRRAIWQYGDFTGTDI